MFRVEETNDPAAFAELRAVWRELHAQTPDASFFQTSEWIETYWRYFGDEQRLRLLVVRDGGAIVGLVPLTVLDEPTRLGRVRVLTYPQAYWGSFYGPIGPRPRESLAAALAHVRTTPREWDLLDLRFTPPTDVDPAASVVEMYRARFIPDSRQTDVTSLIDLPATFDEYLATRTAKWRTNFRRWSRRLADRGEVRYRRVRPRGAAHGDADPHWDVYEACEDVARRSWQGRSTTGTTITHEAVRPFLRDVHVQACAGGAADMNLLYLDDRPIAFLYAYACRENLYGLRIGFDESASRDGVGNLLYMRVVEDSIARGQRTFDLGPGSLEAKRPIRSRIVPIFRRTYGNPYSWRGLMWRAKRGWAARPAREAALPTRSDVNSATNTAVPARSE